MIQVHKKLIWFNDWTCSITRQGLSIMQNEKKSLNVFIPQMSQWQMQCSYIFAYYLLFYPKFRKKHTIIYIERVALHEKQKLHINYSNHWKLFKISYAETVLEVSEKQKVNCCSSSTGLIYKQCSHIKGNFTVNAMEVY